MVANNSGLSILEALYLEQRETSTPFIETFGVFEHDTLTFISNYFVHKSGQLVPAWAHGLLQDFTDCLRHLCNFFLAHFNALLEITLNKGGVKYHEFNLCPLWIFLVMLAYDTDDLLKVVSARPKLSVKSDFW